MKKKIIALLSVLSVLFTFIPSALAAYSDYVGSYYTGNTDGTGYAAMDILTCTDSSVTLRFMRVKNDVETYTYTFDEGSVSGNTASLNCHIVNNVTGSGFDGKATLTFGGLVKLQITSSLGAEMYTGSLPKVNESHFPADSTTTTVATPDTTTVQTSSSDKISIKLNGSFISFESGAEPTIISDRTFVPLRSVFELMNINVFWDEYDKNNILKEQLITCTKNTTIVQFARTKNDNGANVWTLNKWESGSTADAPSSSIDIIEQQPVIINGRTYIPLRIVSELFGAQVDWDGGSRTVIIDCDTANGNALSKEDIGKREDYALSAAQASITADYTSIRPHANTPYYSGDSKFYLFNAIDQYGNVILKITYGNPSNYIDVSPDAETVEIHSVDESATVSTQSADTEVATDVVTEAPTEVVTEAETEAPAETEAATDTAEPTETPAVTE
jgi:hypothetical protein